MNAFLNEMGEVCLETMSSVLEKVELRLDLA